MTVVWTENGNRLVCDGVSRTLFVLDRGGNIREMSGSVKRRFFRYFPSLEDGRKFRLMSSRVWKAVSDAGKNNRLFEDAVGIPY